MSTRAGVLINGMFRMTGITASQPPIYDQTSVLATAVTTGVAITLPASGDYTVVASQTSLTIHLNGINAIYGIDFNTSGTGPNYTAVVFTFDLVAGDSINFREERLT